jgi:hypothetical protein
MYVCTRWWNEKSQEEVLVVCFILFSYFIYLFGSRNSAVHPCGQGNDEYKKREPDPSPRPVSYQIVKRSSALSSALCANLGV